MTHVECKFFNNFKHFKWEIYVYFSSGITTTFASPLVDENIFTTLAKELSISQMPLKSCLVADNQINPIQGYTVINLAHNIKYKIGQCAFKAINKFVFSRRA